MPEPLSHPDGLTSRPNHPPRPSGSPDPPVAPESGARLAAAQPEDLNRLFTHRANAGDVDGLVALYEPDATVVFPPGPPVSGAHAIRHAFTQVLADKPTIRMERRPTVHADNLALTSVQWTMTLTGPGSAADDSERRQRRGHPPTARRHLASDHRSTQRARLTASPPQRQRPATPDRSQQIALPTARERERRLG